MPRTLFDALDRLLEQHRWEDAATELARLEGGDGATDVRLLRGYRRLEEGRGLAFSPFLWSDFSKRDCSK